MAKQKATTSTATTTQQPVAATATQTRSTAITTATPKPTTLKGNGVNPLGAFLSDVKTMLTDTATLLSEARAERRETSQALMAMRDMLREQGEDVTSLVERMSALAGTLTPHAIATMVRSQLQADVNNAVAGALRTANGTNGTFAPSPKPVAKPTQPIPVPSNAVIDAAPVAATALVSHPVVDVTFSDSVLRNGDVKWFATHDGCATKMVLHANKQHFVCPTCAGTASIPVGEKVTRKGVVKQNVAAPIAKTAPVVAAKVAPVAKVVTPPVAATPKAKAAKVEIAYDITMDDEDNGMAIGDDGSEHPVFGGAKVWENASYIAAKANGEAPFAVCVGCNAVLSSGFRCTSCVGPNGQPGKSKAIVGYTA